MVIIPWRDSDECLTWIGFQAILYPLVEPIPAPVTKYFCTNAADACERDPDTLSALKETPLLMTDTITGQSAHRRTESS